MNGKRKICVFTGSRSEYGLLRPLIKKIKDDRDLTLQLVVSGSHLSLEFGYTVKEIEKDGFNIDEKSEILLSSDTEVGTIKSIGLALISYSEIIRRLKPDLTVLLGDRFETFAFAIASYYSKVRICHIHGGEITEGSLDDNIRHSISKLSHYHFTSLEEYRKNLIQMGEDPEKVFCVGAMGLDSIKELNLYSKEEVKKIIGKKFSKYNFLITFNSPTADDLNIENQIDALLNALRNIKDSLFIFTKSNADKDGRLINQKIENFAKEFPEDTVLFDSMGQLLYFSTMKYVDAVIGNSSSGIIEAPSFSIPTVNIGLRQKGRLKGETIIDCKADEVDIKRAIVKSISAEFKDKIKHCKNIYGDGKASEKIIEKIKSIPNTYEAKKFFFSRGKDEYS